MRKTVLSVAAAALLACSPLFAAPAFADDTSTTVSTSTTTTDTSTSTDTTTPVGTEAQQPGLQGIQGDVVRPGADPNDPNTYPFLPPDKTPPTPGVRNHQPQPPASDMTDLAIGKSYTIGTQWPDALFHSSESHFADTGQLTDGQFASLSFSDPGWVGFLRQYGRSVVVDLGSEQNVRRVSLDFLQNLGAGIEFPDSVTYYASDDGVNWYALGTAWSQQGGGDYTPQSQSYDVNTNVNARYIRAQFEDKVFAFADEISVFGYSQPAQGAQPLVGLGQDITQTMGDNYLTDPNAPGLPLGPSGQPGIAPAPGQGAPTPSGYLMSSESATGGIKNMQLVYTGAHGSLGTWTESDFLPMIAQEDANGVPHGWLYDGTLFGPYGSLTSSTAVTNWINDLFSPNIQLSALNQTVGDLKQQLNDPNFKEKIVINIPGLTADPSNFGAIDTSGQNMDLNPADVGDSQATSNKEQVIQWFMQTVLQDWNAAGLSNLQLVGFYWQPESLTVTDPLDAELIQATANAVHRDNLLFYWIPYYGAPGITDWRQLGFDSVMIQPNVSFNWSINAASRLQSTADMGQYYHTGLEMEVHWDATSTTTRLAQIAQNKYFDYFTGGNLYGYENGVLKSYYLNSKTLVTAYQNTDPFYRQIYDNTVQFINDKWTGTTFN